MYMSLYFWTPCFCLSCYMNWKKSIYMKVLIL